MTIYCKSIGGIILKNIQNLCCLFGRHDTGHFIYNHGWCLGGVIYVTPFECDNCHEVLLLSIVDYERNTMHMRRVRR